jgi:hypothetical protein
MSREAAGLDFTVVPLKIRYAVERDLSAMCTVNWFAGTQAPPIIKDLPASLIFAAKQPQTVFGFYRFQMSSARSESSTVRRLRS